MQYFSLLIALNTYACYSKKEYRKASNMTDEDFFAVVILLLCFIEERELRVEECSYSDMQSFIEALCKMHNFDIDVSELTTDIVVSCLQNSGCGHKFNSCLLDKPITFKFIEDRMDEHTHVNNYCLTEQCRKVLYSSLEYEELGHVSISSLILEKQIKAGNFLKADETASRLLLDIDKEKSKLEKYRRDIISNALQFTSESVLLTLDGEYTIFEETDKTLLYLEGVIREVLGGNFEDIKVQEDYILDCVSVVREISEKIKKIIIRNQELMSQIDTVRNTYQEQLLKMDFLLPKNYVNIENEVLKPLITNPDVPFDLHSFLSPLFKFNSFSDTNPNHIIKAQSIVIKDDDENLDLDDEEIIIYYEDDVEKTHQSYTEMLEYILTTLKSKDKVMLSSIAENCSFIKENLGTFRTIISILVGIGKITFNKNKSNSALIKYFNPADVSRFNEEMQEFLLGKTLVLAFTQENPVIIYGKIENGKRERYMVDDIEFSLREE